MNAIVEKSTASICGTFYIQAQLSTSLQGSKFTLIFEYNSDHSFKNYVDDLTLKPPELALK